MELIKKSNTLCTLGGAMFWSLEHDDIAGTACNQGKFPLITTVVKNLNGGSPSPTTTISPTVKPPTTVPTTVKPPTTILTTAKPPTNCDGSFYVDPIDCTKFHRCYNGIVYDWTCPQGLYFDSNLVTCNYLNGRVCNQLTTTANNQKKKLNKKQYKNTKVPDAPKNL
jgi:chitinase